MALKFPQTRYNKSGEPKVADNPDALEKIKNQGYDLGYSHQSFPKTVYQEGTGERVIIKSQEQMKSYPASEGWVETYVAEPEPTKESKQSALDSSILAALLSEISDLKARLEAVETPAPTAAAAPKRGRPPLVRTEEA